MNLEQTKGAIAVMQAWVGGHPVEFQTMSMRKNDKWYALGDNPNWNFEGAMYRIMPREWWINPTTRACVLERDRCTFNAKACGFVKVREVLE